jgi:hypothetical protein
MIEGSRSILPVGLNAVPAPEDGAGDALEESRHQLHLLVPLQVLAPDTATHSQTVQLNVVDPET